MGGRKSDVVEMEGGGRHSQMDGGGEHCVGKSKLRVLRGDKGEQIA